MTATPPAIAGTAERRTGELLHPVALKPIRNVSFGNGLFEGADLL